MDILDDALNSGEKVGDDGEDHVVLGSEDSAEDTIAGVTQGTLTLDPNMQYQFRADTSQGQVTYRVVQVATDGSQGEAQVVTTNAFPAQVAQAVIANPFSNGGSPTADLNQEPRFTYVPSVTGADITNHADVLAATGTLGHAQVATATDGSGQFYVMMSPQDVLQGQRTIAPRAHGLSPRIEVPRGGRDERRRATHNEGEYSCMPGPRPTSRDERRRATHSEVERRRRDKINNWIVQLSKLVPDCAQEHGKQGQLTGILSFQSKGGILAKACEYITSLRTSNARLGESLKDMEKLTVDVELLRQQCEELKQENALLRAQLQQQGIIPADVNAS